MTDILAQKVESDNILSAHNEIRTRINEGRIPELTYTEIQAISDLGTNIYIIYNTTNDQLELWYKGTSSPL